MTTFGTTPLYNPAARSPGCRGRIVVADDVPEIAQFVEEVLAGQGFDVRSASDGDETLSLIQRFRPDLIILDIMMPRMHGIDVLRQLTENPETMPVGVIVCSARTFKQDVEQVRELGAFDV